MVGVRLTCPHCRRRQFVPIQIIAEKEEPRIAEPFITCEACMDIFMVQLIFRSTIDPVLIAEASKGLK